MNKHQTAIVDQMFNHFFCRHGSKHVKLVSNPQDCYIVGQKSQRITSRPDASVINRQCLNVEEKTDEDTARLMACMPEFTRTIDIYKDTRVVRLIYMALSSPVVIDVNA